MKTYEQLMAEMRRSERAALRARRLVFVDHAKLLEASRLRRQLAIFEEHLMRAREAAWARRLADLALGRQRAKELYGDQTDLFVALRDETRAELVALGG